MQYSETPFPALCAALLKAEHSHDSEYLKPQGLYIKMTVSISSFLWTNIKNHSIIKL